MRGFKEEGTTTTPFDMVVLNDLDRFHLAIDVVDRIPKFTSCGARIKAQLRSKLYEHRQYVDDKGIDLPEIRNWKWER